MIPDRPSPTECARDQQVRDTDCAHYDDCLDQAVRADWDAFTCARCPLFVPESARKTAAILRPLRVAAPIPPPQEPPMATLAVPAPSPTSAFERARARQRRVAELEEQLAREKELLREDLVAAEREMAELRGAAVSSEAPKGFRGGKLDEAILAAARERPVTCEDLAQRLGAPHVGQRMRQMEAA